MRRAVATQTSEPLGATDAATLFESCFNGAKSILIAVSGGPDSMALMGLLAGWENGPALAVATVDHGLRAESAAEACFVRDAAQQLGLSHQTLVWDEKKPTSGIQAAAREARYKLLLHHATRAGCSHIALAHHADDQAETVLMRLAAGSGISGLGGMAAESTRAGVTLARPLLSIPKARLIATCKALSLGFIEDPSNNDMAYGRTRTRAFLAQTAGAGLTAARLTRFAERARRASDALDVLTNQALSSAVLHRTDCVTRVNWTAISHQPGEIRLRVLTALAIVNAEEGKPSRLERLEALLAEIDAAHRLARQLRRSIGDQIVTLQSDGTLIVTKAPPRKRGRPA